MIDEKALKKRLEEFIKETGNSAFVEDLGNGLFRLPDGSHCGKEGVLAFHEAMKKDFEKKYK